MTFFRNLKWLILALILFFAIDSVGSPLSEAQSIPPEQPPDSSGRLEKVTLQLRWKHQFQFAGYYAAKEKGFYRENGLDVTIKEGGLQQNAVKAVLENRVEYGVSNSEILLHRLNGKPMVLLAPIFQYSPLVLITRKDSGLRTPRDLIDGTIKMTRDPRDIELHAMFRNEGIDLEQLNIIDSAVTRQDYFDPRFDALSAYLTNEPFYLQQLNIPYHIINPMQYGVDFYGDCLFTSESEIRNHENRVIAFKQASLRGWHYALNHPDEMIRLIVRRYESEKSYEHLRFEAEAIRELVVPDLIEIGHVNMSRWQSIAITFAQYGLIPQNYSLNGFVYAPAPESIPVWLKWLIRILLVVMVLVALVAVILYNFNQRLQKEIKERELSEAAFKESEERYRNVIDNAEILVMIFDRTGSCLLMNNKAAEYFGGKPSDFTDRSFYDFHVEDEAEIYVEWIRQVIDSEQTTLLENITHFPIGPKWLIISIQPLRSGDGKVYAAQLIAQDISKRKQAEDDLKESEERYRAISEITSDFAYAYDLTNRDYPEFRWVTDAIVDITGYELREFAAMEKRWLSVILPEDTDAITQHWKTLHSGQPSVAEYRIRKKNGQICWLRDQAKLAQQDGDDLRVYGAIQDISESKHSKEALQGAYSDMEHRVEERTKELHEINRKLREEIRNREEAEEKLLYAKRQAEQANTAKTEFLANVSHELRTPMHHILNYSKYGLTKFHKVPSEKLLHYFSQIRNTGDRLMLLLNDLLDLSKLETGNASFEMKEVDIHQLINERVSELSSMAEKKALRISIENPTVNTRLQCDAHKIGQVIQNLLSNAIKFSPEGKTIQITFEPSILSAVRRSDSTDVVSALSVFVKDEGIGIPERELETVFDKFVQSSKTRTGAGGTGLGLSISKEIIEAHHGVIYAENNNPEGATFTFTLPYFQPEPPEKKN